MHVVVDLAVAAHALAGAHLGQNRAGDDVARCQVEQGGRVALHEALAVAIAQDAALAAHGFGDQDAQPHDAGGVELKELHVFQGDAAPGAHGRSVAGIGKGVGRDLEHAPESARGEQDGLGGQDVQAAGGQFYGHHPLGGGAVQDQIDHLKFIEKDDFVFDALLVEGLQDHVSGAVGRVTGPPDRPLAEVAGVPAETALVDTTFGGAVEGQTAVFEIVNRLDGLFGQNLGGLLVDQVVAPLDGVEGVPLGLVLLHVAQGGADAALGRAGVAADGVELGKHRRFRSLTGFEGGVKPRPARTDDNRVKLLDHGHLLWRIDGYSTRGTPKPAATRRGRRPGRPSCKGRRGWVPRQNRG